MTAPSRQPGGAGGSSGLPARDARRARAAVATLFVVNGATYASVVPRYPDLKDQLGLSNAALGSAVSAFWLGALLVGLLGGVLVTRWGSGRVATVATLAAAGNLVLVGLAPSWWTLAGALFLAGSFDTVADVAENAHALQVEALYRRSILNSLHGMWSIGAVTGGLAGAAAAGLDVSVSWHLSTGAAVLALVALVGSRLLLPGPGHRAARTVGQATAAVPDPVARAVGCTGGSRAVRRLHLGVGVVALGAFATLAQAVEDTGATWSAVYLRDGLGAAPAIAGLAFVALQVMQTLGRLFGDRTVTRYGDRAVARAGALLAGTGLGLALAVPSTAGTIAGFGVVGLGIATLIPAAMRTADALPGLAPGVGLTLVGSVSRVGSLAAPPVIGLLADTYSLRAALLVVPVAATLVLLLAPALTSTSRSPRRTRALSPLRRARAGPR